MWIYTTIICNSYCKTNNGKAHEFKIDIEWLFVEFKKTFDSIESRNLIILLKDLGIYPKINEAYSRDIENDNKY